MPHIKKTYVVTTKDVDFVPLTHDIAAAIKEAGAVNGMACVMLPKGGAGLLIFRNSPENQASVTPQLHAAMLPRSIALPVVDGVTPLAPYEEVILVDCEERVHRREVIIAVTPEGGGEPQ